MRPDLLRERKTRAHQKCRPVDGMETDDVFSNDVHVGGPITLLLVIGTAHGAEISSQRVEPDIKNVRLFARNGNAPANRSPRDAEIAQAAFDKAKNLVAARFRLDEFWMLGVPIEQRFLKRGKLEKIIRFGDRFRRPAAI